MSDTGISAEVMAGITTGVSGREWRATVTPWGRVDPWDGSEGLDWYVAADDRWHRPSQEPTLRQQRVGDMAVVRTRLRVPTGDVVHTVYSVAAEGGLTVVEVANESTMPVAVAFTRRDLRSERPIPEQPIRGIDLPADSCVVPLGHRARVRVALAHDGRGAGPLPAGLADAEQVVRGWQTIIDRAGRMTLPEAGGAAAQVAAVRARRCELLLGDMAVPEEDPAGFLVDLEDLARLGEPMDPWLGELAVAVERLARVVGWEADTALESAARVLARCGDRRALRDLARLRSRRGACAPRPVAAPSGAAVRFGGRWLEQLGAHGLELLPAGIPPAWYGVNVEMHGLPVGDLMDDADHTTGHGVPTVSFAIRWHGERPAVLWELNGAETSGAELVLRAPAVDPDWRTEGNSGEALWPAPPEGFTPPTPAPVSMPVQLGRRPPT